ncbi:MAG: Gfo/Idh/MocA family protein [Geminicoccaceae bacterium]
MQEIGIGLIGTGFMGKSHALAYRAVKAVFGDVPTPKLETLCDVPSAQAERFREQFGFARATSDWRELVVDPAVDLVSITTPNAMHKEIALAAIAAGKIVYCEKPMAVTLEDAEEMAAAAEKADVPTMVGYNYIHNPAVTHAKTLIDQGAIGRVILFRGIMEEDYMADAALPWSWRCLRAQAGLGALGDMGCHLVSVAHHLVGQIVSVSADTATPIDMRPRGDGSGDGPVENEDIANALLRFDNGAPGMLSTSRVAWGRKSRLAWEVHGDQGQITFDQERMNELQFFAAKEPKAVHGFKTILTGPAHPPYGQFCPAPGHGLGFNDQKAIELHQFLRGIIGAGPLYPSFAHGIAIERVIHAIDRSARDDGRKVPLAEVQPG